MKSLFILLLVAASTITYTQNDVSVTFNDYTYGEETSDDPLYLVFSITNESATAVPVGDTLFFAFLVGGNNYSMDLTAGSVSYVKLTSNFEPGETFDLATLSVPPSVMDMQWIYEEMGALTGNICAVVGVGIQSLYHAPGADANYLDNTTCVAYTVTEVAGIEQEEKNELSIYPTPASNSANLKLGTLEGEIYVTVTDLSGRIVYAETVFATYGKTHTIDTELLENGNYIVTISQNGAALVTEKLVIVK